MAFARRESAATSGVEKRVNPERPPRVRSRDAERQLSCILGAPPRHALAPTAIIALQRAVGNRATGRLIAGLGSGQRSAPAGRAAGAYPIQRKIEWMGGAKTHDMDLTEPLTLFTDFGVTPARINVEEFPGGNAANAIFPPDIQVEKTFLGLSRAAVFKVPVNFVGYRMRLPKPPPSRQTVDTEMVLSALNGHAPASAEPALKRYGTTVQGPTRLEAHGLPSDAEFANLVEEHEDHHVDEIKEGVRAILRPWDSKLEAFKSDNTSFTRTSPESAKQALLKAAGGTPTEIGQRLVDDLKARGIAFHDTHEGSSPTIDRVDADEASARITIYWKHPLS
ncbi:MAG: hypothetical protein ACRDJW_00540 [Thermomicrobiales bacterium]